jgi:hypothetical protein
MARIVIPYQPREAFKPLHNRTARWACVVAHRRCGKTVACINDIIKRALLTDKKDYRGAYIAPFYVQAKQVAWDYFKKYTVVIPGIKYNEAELRVDFPNGSRIQLFGADNPDRLRGMYFDDLIADEYGDWKPSVWPYVIRPCLADRQGNAIVIGTPKGRNAFYETWLESKRNNKWLSLTLRVSETKLLPESEIEELKRELSEEAWRQEMECDFEAAIPGAYYGKLINEARQQGRITQVDYDPNVPVHTAWDLGYSDDTAIWWYQVIGGEIHILEHHSSNGEDVAFYGELVKSKSYKYGIHWLPHDARAKTLASGGKSIQEQLAAHLGRPSIRIVPELSLQDGIQAARLMMPRVWFDECTEPGINALAQYQREYDEDKKTFREKPRHDWTSHSADAFRYLAIAWRTEAAPDKTKETRFPVQGVGNIIQTATLSELWETSKPNRGGRI